MMEKAEPLAIPQVRRVAPARASANVARTAAHAHPAGEMMTDRIALAMGLVIVALIGLDLVANGGDAMMFLALKIIDLVEFLSFWR